MNSPFSPRWTLALAVVMAIAIVGFLGGTRHADYDLEPPVTVWQDRAPSELADAPTYAQLRRSAPRGDVATACVDCHDDRASPVDKGLRTEHPVDVHLITPVSSALMEAGAKLGSDEQGRATVQCRTCHTPHNAQAAAELVLPVERLCAQCHSAERGGQGKHPVLGSISSGLAKRVARLAGVESDLNCVSCHSPHDANAGTLLRTPAAGTAACETCHVPQREALHPGGHGARHCTDCHGMHDAAPHVGRADPVPDPSDQACANCHLDHSPTTQIDLAAGHPMWRPSTAPMQSNGHQGNIGCTDCHAPHSTADDLLAERCATCHPAQGAVTGTDHDAAVVGVNGEGRTCLSCHTAHGATSKPTEPDGVNPASAVCLSCHDGRSDGAHVIERYSHPTGLLLTTNGLPFRDPGDEVPYYGPDGRRTSKIATGEITCQTCHDPHRWRHGEVAHPGDVEGSEQDSFLRDPDSVAVFCGVCHGVDGRPRYRFFHETRFRKTE